jgi:hypothetical protein
MRAINVACKCSKFLPAALALVLIAAEEESASCESAYALLQFSRPNYIFMNHCRRAWQSSWKNSLFRGAAEAKYWSRV